MDEVKPLKPCPINTELFDMLEMINLRMHVLTGVKPHLRLVKKTKGTG